jgi:hypothetical protein
MLNADSKGLNEKSVQNSSTAVCASAYACTVHCAQQHEIRRYRLDTMDQPIKALIELE